MAAAAILINQHQKSPYLGWYSVTMHTVQSWTCELGYGADTMFHRTYFLLESVFEFTSMLSRSCLVWNWDKGWE